MRYPPHSANLGRRMARRLAVPRPASVSPRGFVHLGAYHEPLLAEPTVAEPTVAEQSHQQLLSRPSNPCWPGCLPAADTSSPQTGFHRRTGTGSAHRTRGDGTR